MAFPGTTYQLELNLLKVLNNLSLGRYKFTVFVNLDKFPFSPFPWTNLSIRVELICRFFVTSSMDCVYSFCTQIYPSDLYDLYVYRVRQINLENSKPAEIIAQHC
jgi:hypothetical protein